MIWFHLVMYVSHINVIVLTHQYLNDLTFKNMDWALCTGILTSRDVGIIERRFLAILDFNLSLSEDNILVHFRGIAQYAWPSIVAHFE